ncbi:flavodoxin domain-containing protein [Actinomyces vulturis]|uniref:flavodoxin domain-containing protein n=1 Tax=Actinomyces vulturis TaxID=1857645 RepID=UPI000830F931|nr:flavodoxin domain-containing protein [Actinomyces vulturis]
MNILLVAASKHGSTQGVAEVIAEVLKERGHSVDLFSPTDAPDIAPYDALIVGSAVYMTKWMPEAVDFTKRVKHEKPGIPVWAFSVGLSGLPQGEISDPSRVGPVLLNIQAKDHRTFPGRFDPSQLSLRERSIARLGGASEGDWRDFDDVRDWALTIADELDK